MAEKKRNWKKRLGITVIVLFVVYTVAGFLLTPLLLRYVGLRKANEALAGKVSIEAIRVNPFAYSLTLRGIDVTTAQGQSVFTAERFYGNFAFWSLFGKGWRFQEVHLASPQVNVVLDREQNLNLLSVVDLTKIEPEQEPDTEAVPFVIPLLKVDRMWIDNGGFEVSLALPGGEFQRKGHGINVELSDFSTDPHSENPYSFIARTSVDEMAKVEGKLMLNPLSTSGAVSIESVQLSDLDTFTGDQLGFGIEDGRFSLGFNYFFSPVSEPRGLFIDQGHVRVENLALLATGEPTPFQKLGLFEATGLGVDLLEGSVTFDTIRLEDSYLRVVRDKEGLLNLIRYLFPQSTQEEIVAQVQAELAREQQPMQERDIRLGLISADQDLGVALTSAWNQVQKLVAFRWKVQAGEVSLRDNVLELRDEFTAVPVDFALSAITLQATDLRNFGAEPFPFSLSLGTTGGGEVAAQGSFTPEPESAQVNFEVKDFSFVPFAPYLAGLLTADLVSAKGSAKGDAAVSFPAEQLPKAGLNVDASLNALQINEKGTEQPVLEVASVLLEEARATSDPIAFHADLLLIRNPSLKIIRGSDQQINLLQMIPLLQERLDAQNASAAVPDAAAEKSTASATGSAAAPAAVVDTAKEAEQKVSAVSTLSQPVELENFSLRELRIEGGRVMVIDNGIVPPASFAMTDVRFKFGPVILKEGNVSRFDGSVRFADGARGEASVTGELVTLDPLASTRFSVNTVGITLGTFGGYSDPMVGRPLEQGTLDATLDYSVADSKLRGENTIRMNQVSFAPRRAESTGPSLPLDLGMAILVDRNGVMRLDVPISGDLNDPDFSLSRVIQYAVINVFEKLVTAPFAMLGSLLGSGDERPATAITFEPGSVTIPQDQQRGLSLLADVLYERPTLALVLVPVDSNPQDLESLRDQLLQKRIDAYAKEHSISPDRATARLYDQLVAALPAMDLQARAPIEAMIAAASQPVAPADAAAAAGAGAAGSSAASAAGTAAAKAPTAGVLQAPPPIVEGSSGASIQTVRTRHVERARTGNTFHSVVTVTEILVPPVATSAATAADTADTTSAAADATGLTAATETQPAAGVDAATAADAAASASAADGAAPAAAETTAETGAGSAADPAAGAVPATAAVVAAKAPAQQRTEPSLADKRTILLSQTMVSKAALQEMIDARTDAIAKALEAEPEHPLGADRIRVGEPWKPNAADTTQRATPTVYFELGTLQGGAGN